MPRIADPRTKIELLRAAEAVFAEHGLSPAKVEDITARAGVSKGAFYLHFDSKDDCWRQIIEGFLAKMADCVEPRPEEMPGGADPRVVVELWHQHDLEVFEFCWQNRGLLKMMLAGGGGAPYAYLIDEFAARIAENTVTMIRRGIEAGLYHKDLVPEVAASMVSGAYDRLVRDLIAQPRRPDLAAWSRQGIHFFTRGLLADGPRAVLDREVNGDGRQAGAEAASRGARVERA